MSAINSNQNQTQQPYVGMGVTYGIGSDCYPYSISRVISPKKVAIRPHIHRPDPDKPQGYEHNNWIINPYPIKDSTETIISLRKNGRWKRVGDSMKDPGGFFLGRMRFYQDPSF